MAPKIFESEFRFCQVLWDHEPVTSAVLAKLCKEELSWSRTTTYTVIKRLADRGVVRNDNSLITSLVTREEAQASEIDELVDKKFGGSLPAFVAAFTRRQDLSDAEIDAVQAMIDRFRKEKCHE